VKIHGYYSAAIIQAALIIIASPVARAQDTATDGYVNRKEYEELKAQMLAMKKELDAMKKEKEAAPREERPQSEAVANVHKQVASETVPAAAQSGSRSPLSKQKACSAQPSFSLPVGRRGCLKRAMVKSLRFRPLLIQFFFGN
jgi:hypothetical protein